jgi:tRNA-dihydrouridine synthase A
LFFGDTAPAISRANAVTAYVEYAIRAIAEGARPHHVLRHMVGLFHGCANARTWRQTVARIGQSGSDPHELLELARSLEEGLSLAA